MGQKNHIGPMIAPDQVWKQFSSSSAHTTGDKMNFQKRG